MDWGRDAGDWPNRDLSRFVETRTQRWHVQRGGSGPGILLLHGAGAATHSWRALLPLLTPCAEVLAPDLPGHGFTHPRSPGRSGLAPMAEDLGALLAAESFRPDLVIGHSAGAAIGLRMLLDGLPAGKLLGLNPALMPFRGLAGIVFPPLAKLLALNPLTAPVFARTASGSRAVRNLIEGTGSRIDDTGLALYRRLISDPGHVEGALRMMARWDLGPLLADLPRVATPCVFAIGLKDRAVPPESVRAQAARMPDARVVAFRDCGHLIHEEAPGAIASLTREMIGAAGP